VNTDETPCDISVLPARAEIGSTITTLKNSSAVAIGGLGLHPYSTQLGPVMTLTTKALKNEHCKVHFYPRSIKEENRASEVLSQANNNMV
jgi:hypothetical protein